MRPATEPLLLKILLTFYFSLAPAFHALAAPPQDPPMEWGSIPAGDLAMSSYPQDTSAPAVVLCDFGETKLDNDMHLVFTRHTRIKLFSQAGFEQWGTHSISVYSKDDAELVDDIEGATYTLAPDGSVNRTKLDDRSVFKETYDRDYTRYRFTLPALQKGSVIEYRYTITAKSPFDIRDWVFQKTIPVRWSEYRLTMPKQLLYVAATRGYIAIQTSEEESPRLFSGRTETLMGQRFVPCNELRWFVPGAAALPDEPFVTTINDYAARLDLRLYQYALTYTGRVTVTKTWEELRKELLGDADFGKRMDPPGEVRDIAARYTAGRSTADEKIASLYNYVKDNVTWTGFHGIYSFTAAGDVLHAGKGSAPEIAFLLAALLRSAGIQADPVIVSTRAHGEIETQFPMIHQFNYVLVRAQEGGRTYFLDATDPGRPMQLLPSSVLNVKGLVVKEGADEWVTLLPPRIDSRRSQADMTLGADGGIAGTVESTCEQYSAFARRRELRDKSAPDVAKQLFDADRAGLSVDAVVVTGKDSLERPVVIRANIASGTYAQSAGDFLYVNPTVIDRLYATPFKSVERKFPVSMLYGSRVTSTVNIRIPGGYEIRETPPDMRAAIGREDAYFLRNVNVEGSVVRVRSDLVVNRTDYPPEMYPQIRAFYDQVMSLQSEKIVLQKKALIPAKKTRH